MSQSRFLAALVAFVAVAAASSLPSVRAWDRSVTTAIQEVAHPVAVPAAVLVACADAEVLVLGTLLTGLVLLPRAPRRAQASFQLAAALVGVSLLGLALKYALPFAGPPREFRLLSHRPGMTLTTPYSFPSGHTLRATLVAGTVLRRRPILAAVLVGSLMGALVLLGDHWMTDVLGGLALGWACVEAARGIRASLLP